MKLQLCEPLVVHAHLLGANAVARNAAGGVGGVVEESLDHGGKDRAALAATLTGFTRCLDRAALDGGC